MTLIQWLRKWLIPPGQTTEAAVPPVKDNFDSVIRESQALRERTLYEQRHRERVLKALEARAKFRSGGSSR